MPATTISRSMSAAIQSCSRRRRAVRGRMPSPTSGNETPGDGPGGRGRTMVCRLPDQEFFQRATLAGLLREPFRLLATAGPGFGGIGRVAVFRRDLAQLAALGAGAGL